MSALLEVVILPVSDPDLSLHFYRDLAGFDLDVDYAPAPDFQVVQLTPKGSSTSIQFGVVCRTHLMDACGACTWWSQISNAPDVSSSTAVYVSAISGIRTPTAAGGEAFVRAPTPTAPITQVSRTSATPTATAGCCRSAGTAAS